jgi:hypothetical protein
LATTDKPEDKRLIAVAAPVDPAAQAIAAPGV